MSKEMIVAGFERKRVLPLRRALGELKEPMYLYCVPAVNFETELTTGRPIITEGDLVLCLLPKTVAVAEHFGLSRQEIELLAPQVLWLIRMLCSFHTIKTPADLKLAYNGWTHFITPGVLEQMQAIIAESNPTLLLAS